MKQSSLHLPFCNAFVPFITLVLPIVTVFVSPSAIADPSGNNNQPAGSKKPPVASMAVKRNVAASAVGSSVLAQPEAKGIVHVGPNIKPIAGAAKKNEDASGKNDRAVGSTKSPTLGKPYIELHVDHNGINPGSPIHISGRDFPSGAALAISLDGHPVQSVTVEPNGRFNAKLTAPEELGVHTLVVTDSATGKVVDGMTILVRRGGEDEEDRREEKQKQKETPKLR